MTIVQEIENQVSGLQSGELEVFRAWFEQFDAAIWDKQIEEDAKSGKLDSISRKAITDFKRGNFKEL